MRDLELGTPTLAISTCGDLLLSVENFTHRDDVLDHIRCQTHIDIMEGDLETREEINWAEGQALVGASDMQTRFARAIVEGLNQTAAARAAGYSGEVPLCVGTLRAWRNQTR
jgi:hypothetical protein